MKIAVIGIGGVGGYFGGKLARTYIDREDNEVIFFARGEHLKKIRERGLRQITREGTFTAIPDSATDNSGGCGNFDLVLFCVKSYDLEEGARMIRENVTGETAIISLLNGVDNAEKLHAVFPDAQVLNGCVYISACIERPGVVRQTGGSCNLFFGPEREEGNDYRDIESILKDAGIKAEHREDIRAVVWEKYLFVCPLASATAYLVKTFGELMDHSESRKLLEGLLDEVELVGRAQGVNLPEDIHRTSLEKV